MENNKKVEKKPVSDAQNSLIVKVLKSRKILDDEYKLLKEILDNKVKDSYSASILIEYLLALVKFRRYFLSKRMKAYKKCYYCGIRDGIDRYVNLTLKKDIWLCEDCMLNSRNSIVPLLKNGDVLETPEVDSDFLYEQHRDDEAMEELDALHER